MWMMMASMSDTTSLRLFHFPHDKKFKNTAGHGSRHQYAFGNPYVKTVNGKLSIELANAEAYVDRSGNFPHKIDHDDLCYKLFTRYGFIWGR